jgi:hypothetical protein
MDSLFDMHSRGDLLPDLISLGERYRVVDTYSKVILPLDMGKIELSFSMSRLLPKGVAMELYALLVISIRGRKSAHCGESSILLDLGGEKSWSIVFPAALADSFSSKSHGMSYSHELVSHKPSYERGIRCTFCATVALPHLILLSTHHVVSKY